MVRSGAESPVQCSAAQVFGPASEFCELHSSGGMDFAQILVPASGPLHVTAAPLVSLKVLRSAQHSHLRAFALAIPVPMWLTSSLKFLLRCYLLSVIFCHTQLSIGHFVCHCFNLLHFYLTHFTAPVLVVKLHKSRA